MAMEWVEMLLLIMDLVWDNKLSLITGMAWEWEWEVLQPLFKITDVISLLF